MLHFTSYFTLTLSYCLQMEHKPNKTTEQDHYLTLAFVPKVGTFGTSPLLADHDVDQPKELTCYCDKTAMNKCHDTHSQESDNVGLGMSLPYGIKQKEIGPE